VIQEANALGCQSIDVWGFVVLASVAGQIGISEVIGQDENDVWPGAARWDARWVARRWIGQQFDRTQAQQADEQASPDRAYPEWSAQEKIDSRNDTVWRVTHRQATLRSRISEGLKRARHSLHHFQSRCSLASGSAQESKRSAEGPKGQGGRFGDFASRWIDVG
jgi:hypothetical protein